VPSLDLRFADNKTLGDAVGGGSLVTFTRASSATYTDSAGVLRSSVTNLLLRSEEFDNASWTKFRGSIAPNAETAPSGTLTADKLVEDTTATNTHGAFQTVTVANGAAYTFSCYIKAGERTSASFRVSLTGSEINAAFFNLSTGVVLSTGSGYTATITSVGANWYRCSVTATSSVTSSVFVVNTAIGTNNSYTGDGTSGIYLWGAQLEQSSTVGEYIPTTSTINSAPRFDHSITSSTTNLLLRSEEFNDASWVTGASGNATVTPNATQSPIGTLTADLLDDSSTTQVQAKSQANAITSSSRAYTASVYIKQNSSSVVSLRLSIGTGGTTVAGEVVVNLASGAAQWRSGASNVGTTFAAVNTGNGWFRVSVTVTDNATGNTSATVELRPAFAATYSDTLDVTAQGSAYYWGAQLEQSSTVGPYVPTTTAAATSNTTESLGLLVEEARTNSIRNNTGVGVVAGTPGTPPTNWQVNGIGTLTQQIVGTGVDNGINYIDIRLSGTTSTTQVGFRFETNTGATGTNGQTFTHSCWFARVAGSSNNITAVTCNANLYDAGGAYITSPGFTGFDAGTNVTSFIRRAGTLTIASATSAFIQPQIAISFNPGVAIDATFRIGLPQLEQGAFATSVIPTTSATVTRAADVASITGSNFSSWASADKHTLYAEIQRPSAVNANTSVASLSDGTLNNVVRYRLDSNGSTSTWLGVTSGTNDGVVQVTTGTAGLPIKAAGGAELNSYQLAVNGVLGTQDTSALMPSVNRLEIGAAGGIALLNGTIKRLTYWPTRLANNTLQQITQS
jgi:hypothetical protein